MYMEMFLSAEQRQKISQSQIQWLKLLAMDNMELKQMLETEYLENPLLEHKETEYEPSRECMQQLNREGMKFELTARDNGYFLEEAITSQLPMDKYDDRQWNVIRYLIGNLEENGFFMGSVTDAAKANGVPEDMVACILEELKGLEPYGIFAANLEECLLIQLDAQSDNDPLKRKLISQYLNELAQGKINVISRELHASTAQIRKCLKEISRLNPRPLNGFYTAETSYIVPDIILTEDVENKCFQARLNDDWTADYHISDYYRSMMTKTSDAQLAAYFDKKYRRAKFLIAGIEQRRETILSIADYIGRIQYPYLRGTEHKKPVTMTDAAKALGVAVSTVSRAVKGKYIQYPAGSVFFKELFETAITLQENTVSTRGDAKEQIKILINNENKEKPLSDIELARELEKRQIIISRRTVAKYRDSMGIKGCFDRKCF